jgi:hypothetical protein
VTQRRLLPPTRLPRRRRPCGDGSSPHDEAGEYISITFPCTLMIQHPTTFPGTIQETTEANFIMDEMRFHGLTYTHTHTEMTYIFNLPFHHTHTHTHTHTHASIYTHKYIGTMKNII